LCNLKNVSIFAVMKVTKNENFNRTLEVAMVQNHPVLILPEIKEEYNNIAEVEEIKEQFKEFVNLKPSLRSIKIEYVRTDSDSILDTTRLELFENVLERSKNAKLVVEGVSDKLSDVCKHLLKSAIQKLDLNKVDVDLIISIACSIAALDKSLVLRPEHIAEAIQYSYVVDDYEEIINLRIKELQAVKKEIRKYRKA